MSLQVLIDAAIHYGGLMLIHGSVLAFVTWLLSVTILRRSQPSVQAVLWVIVLAKFLLPPVLPGELALSGLIAQAETQIVSRIRVAAEPPAPSNALETPVTNNSSADSWTRRPLRLLFACYVLLVVGFSVRAFVVFSFRRRAIRGLPLAESCIQEEVFRLAKLIGLKTTPQVRITNDGVVPYVFGFRRTVMIFPERLLQTLSSCERQSIILHELAHIRRKDTFTRALENAARIVFFFFPPVLWVSRRLEHLTEIACDRWALSVSELGPRAYAEALIKVVKELQVSPQTQVGLSFVRNVRLLEDRLRAVLRENSHASPRLRLSAKLVLVSWSLFVLLGGSTAVRTKAIRSSASLPTGYEENLVVSENFGKEDSPNDARNQDPNEPGQNRELLSREQFPRQRRAQPSDRDQRGPETTRSFETLTVAERRDLEINLQTRNAPIESNSTMSPYEQGYLLGRRFAQEEAARSPKGGTLESTTGTEELSKTELKRAIEIRMRELSRHPPLR